MEFRHLFNVHSRSDRRILRRMDEKNVHSKVLFQSKRSVHININIIYNQQKKWGKNISQSKIQMVVVFILCVMFKRQENKMSSVSPYAKIAIILMIVAMILDMDDQVYYLHTWGGWASHFSPKVYSMI